MAESKLEVEQRLDRIELAIGTMAQWLVQAQTGFGAHDAAGIEKILRGEQKQKTQITAEELAQLFHEEYERRAPEFGYETRKLSAVPWEDVPEQNKQLMVAVAEFIIKKLEL